MTTRLRSRKDYLDTLEELAEDIRHTRPVASHFAAVWISVGLRMAADLLDSRRFEILTERMCDDNEE